MSVYSYKIPSSGKVLWRFELIQNGKRYTKRGFKNKTEAKNHRLTYLAKLGNNEAIVPKKLDLATYLNNWIKEAQDNRDYRDTTHIKYQNQIKLIIPEIGHIKLCDLNISHVKRMRERLLKKYSPKYIASTEVVLKSALKEGEEHIGLSPLRKLKPMGKKQLMGITGKFEDILTKKEKIKWFEPEEQEKLLQTAWDYSMGVRVYNYIKKPRQKNLVPFMLIYLALYTGARRGELYALSWDKIDLEKGTILIDMSIEYSSGDNYGKPDLTKTGEERTIEITKQDIEMLKRYRVWVKEKLLPMRADINKVPVFFDSDLGFLHSTQAWKQTKTIIRQAKLMPEGVKETRTFHDLRHSHASLLIDKEVYPPKIQKRLGHASLKITMDVYGHFFDKHDKKMVDTLEEIQGGGKVVENFR